MNNIFLHIYQIGIIILFPIIYGIIVYPMMKEKKLKVEEMEYLEAGYKTALIDTFWPLIIPLYTIYKLMKFLSKK